MRTILIISAVLFASLGLAQPAGTLDASFGTGGKVLTSFGSFDKAYGVVIQPDDKIVVAGYTTSAITGKDFICVRYNPDGSLDNTFGVAGVVTTDLQVGSDDVAYSLTLQSDGKIILAGYSDDGSNRNAAMVRYETDGSIDPTFGVSGIVLTDFEASQQDEIKTVKIHALTGNIIVGGSSVISSSQSKPVVARYLSDGNLDLTFNTTGIRLLWVTALDYQYQFAVEDLVVQSSGKISAVGWRNFTGMSWDHDYWACRINSDGSMDNTFSGDGVNVYNGPFNGSDQAFSMLLQPDNSFLVSGGGYISTLRFDFTGFQIDADGTGGAWDATTDYGSLLDDISYAFQEDLNGKFVMAGSSGNTTNKSFALYRTLSDGSTDNSFGTSGKVTTTFGANAFNECFDMKIQSDNKIVAVGYSGNSIAIARYLGNDTPDLDNFSLVAPANLAINQNYASLMFDWTNAFGATGYELELDVSAAFDVAPQIHTATISTKTIGGMEVNTQYFWRVRATDGTNFGAYSTVWSFTTNTLENFNLISPANNSVNQAFLSLNFDWSNALGATTYEMEIDSSITFSENPASYTVSSSAQTLTDLVPETDYFWHVRASNDGVNFGNWSDTWKLTTKEDLSASITPNETRLFNVYPVPASSHLFIKADVQLTGTVYMIYDATGKVVLSGVISSENTQVALDNIPAGTYFLEVAHDQKERIQFVKTN